MVPVRQWVWGLLGQHGGDTKTSPGNSRLTCSPPTLLPGEIHRFPGKPVACPPTVSAGKTGWDPSVEGMGRILALIGQVALGKELTPLCLSFPVCCEGQVSHGVHSLQEGSACLLRC